MARPADLVSFIGDIFAIALGFLPGRFSQVGAVDVDRQGARFVMWALLFLWGKRTSLTSTVPASFEPCMHRKGSSWDKLPPVY